MSRPREGTLEQMFWRRVSVGAGCWEWIGHVNAHGYGTVKYERRIRKAYRLSWELHFGPIPTGICVCHTCDNRTCVNPAHLWLGTNDENMADMKAKGRAWTPSGAASPHAKLDEAKAAAIRAERSAGAPVTALMQRYGVSRTTICEVAGNRRWTAGLRAMSDLYSRVKR